MRSNLPNRSTSLPQVRIGLLLHRDVSLSLALVFRDLFAAANRELGTKKFTVELIAPGNRTRFKEGDISVSVSPFSGRYHYLVVPPMTRFNPEAMDWSEEIAMIIEANKRGTKLASACLGALMLASAGLLDGKIATTHWRWASYASMTFPNVKWEPSQMICESGTVITAGGFLALIDLALHLVSRTTSKKTAHELAQVLLADSIRQKQSVYAQTLVPAQGPGSDFAPLEAWVKKNLRSPISIAAMAEISRMSPRSFHRHFVNAYGVTPNKYLQLKRIERSQELLRDSSLSLEEIVESVGLSDITSFRRVFTRELGLSPSEFRRKIKG